MRLAFTGRLKILMIFGFSIAVNFKIYDLNILFKYLALKAIILQKLDFVAVQAHFITRSHST
jgi:hypothetical protein